MSEHRSEHRDDADRRPAAYIGAIIASIVMVWIVNAIPGWNWRFITGDFQAVLWATNLSLGMQIAGNVLLFFFHPRFLHYLVQALLNAVSILALIIVVTVYPFDFDAVFAVGNTVVRIVLYVAIGGAVVATVVNTLKAFGSFFGSTAD